MEQWRIQIVFFTNNVVALYYIFTSKPTGKEVGLQPKIDEHRISILR